jgi:hypothetical protein
MYFLSLLPFALHLFYFKLISPNYLSLCKGNFLYFLDIYVVILLQVYLYLGLPPDYFNCKIIFLSSYFYAV